MPDTPGLETFPGEMIHSHDYRHPELFRDKTVLCLGAAASGMDISIDISAYANTVGGEVSADLSICTWRCNKLAVLIGGHLHSIL